MKKVRLLYSVAGERSKSLQAALGPSTTVGSMLGFPRKDRICAGFGQAILLRVL